MTLYGKGTLCYPGTARVVHDFEDGPFQTLDPIIIKHALASGCSDEPPRRGRPPAVKPDADVKLEAEKPKKGRE